MAPSSRPFRPPALLLAALAGGAFTLLGCMAFNGSRSAAVAPFHTELAPPVPLITQERRAEFAGSEACRECHAAEFEQHARSLHAQTLHPATDPRYLKLFQTNQVLQDRSLGVTYTFSVKDGKPVTTVREKDGSTRDYSPAFILGHGKHGVTPVLEKDGVYMEARASHYFPMNRWYWTPGQQGEFPGRRAEGRRLERDEAVRCFLCHGTAVVQSENQPVGPGSIFQVGCERCHGPGQQHIEAARKGLKGGGLYTFSQASAGTVLQLCAQCHRQPTDRPAEDDPDLPRFAGTALAASECFKKSKGTLSCVTCHNPHQSVSTDAAGYERVCLGCHSTAGARTGSTCPVNPTRGCVSCHMPAQSINFPGGARFHNHWIRVYEKQPQARAADARLK